MSSQIFDRLCSLTWALVSENHVADFELDRGVGSNFSFEMEPFQYGEDNTFPQSAYGLDTVLTAVAQFFEAQQADVPYIMAKVACRNRMNDDPFFSFLFFSLEKGQPRVATFLEAPIRVKGKTPFAADFPPGFALAVSRSPAGT